MPPNQVDRRDHEEAQQGHGNHPADLRGGNAAIDQTVRVPEFRGGRVNRVEWAQSDVGGKGVSVASFLADFGEPATATGLLGSTNDDRTQALGAARELIESFEARVRMRDHAAG